MKFSKCEVPTAVLLKMQVLWNLTLCWLVNGYALKALHSYKILLTIYWLTQCNFPEDLHLQIKFVFTALVKMRRSFTTHELTQSSSDRWHLSMLAVIQTTTPVMKCISETLWCLKLQCSTTPPHFIQAIKMHLSHWVPFQWISHCDPQNLTPRT